MIAKDAGFVYAHWDGTHETEQKIKEETKATIRCIPLNNKLEEGSCIYSGNPSNQKVLFAKAYQMTKKDEILNKLCQKAATKQAVYRTTKDVFEELKVFCPDDTLPPDLVLDIIPVEPSWCKCL